MKTQWDFYLSGILYGKIYEEQETKTVSLLDVYTGKWGQEKPFTQEESLFFQKLCSRDLLEFFEEKSEYEENIRKAPAGFVTGKGEAFTCRRGESYFQRHQKFPKDLFFDGKGIYAVLMSARDAVGVLVKKGWEEKTVLREWKKVYPRQNPEWEEFQPGQVWPVSQPKTFYVTTRDGERLATDVYLPLGIQEKCPAVLVRTPYGKSKGTEVYWRFVQRGYAVVIQDTRGREDSTGEWLPQHFEVEDGDDTLNWIAAQPWSDGQVSMTGGSYLGYVQWAAAASGNPHLKAMLSSVCAGSAFVDIPRRGGCFNSGMLAWGFAMAERQMRPELMAQENWDEILKIRPLKDIPKIALGHEVDFLTKWLEHRDMDQFWKKNNWKARYQGNPVPALILSGWFDDNGMGTTEALELVKTWPKGTWKAVLGPWKHSGNADYDIHNIYMGEDALRYDVDMLCMMWLEHFLKGAENGIEKTPAVEYYTLGEGCWKSAENWPPENTVSEKLYLAGGQAPAKGDRENCGKGRLTAAFGEEKGAEEYTYDPENPAVHLVDMSENELEVPEDYTKEEKREDILSFTTEKLSSPVTITGELSVLLYASCDCPDTDFFVRITDVDEQGKSVKLADGVLGAKYRNGFEHPQYMEEGKVYPIRIRTTKISNTFREGHRIRLTITSSGENFIFPNSNTEEGFDSDKVQKAKIKIHWGGDTPSRIEFFRERQCGNQVL